MGDQLMTQIPDTATDSVIITPTKAIFVFSIDNKSSWSWYRDDTSMNTLEYGWWTDFNLDNTNYSCGYRLFKHPFAQASTGSFEKLIQDGQVDLSSRQRLSQKQTSNGRTKVQMQNKRDDDAQVESLVQSNKLILLLQEQQIIQKFRKERPDSLTFYEQAPELNLDRQKVEVTYTSQ